MTNYELILCGIGVLLVLVIVWKFGHAIGKFILGLALLAVVGIGATALLTQATASREASKAMKVAATGQAVASAGQTLQALVIGALALALVTAIGVAGFFWLRWQLTQRQALTAGRRKRKREREAIYPPQPEVYYVMQEPDADAVDLDLAEWGW